MQIITELKKNSHPDKAAVYSRFFKTGKGQYAEGDKFLGLKLPEIREITKKYDLSFEEIAELLKNEYHELRMAGVLNLVYKYEKYESSDIVDFYINNTYGVNNWDLVDVSCSQILGKHILKNNNYKKKLYQLSDSKNMWEQRISIVSTYALIKAGEYDDTLKLSKKFLNHNHDLMHKACGWMLREVGKKDVNVLRAFLNEHNKVMPRTMLRYSIEKLSADEKKHYMTR